MGKIYLEGNGIIKHNGKAVNEYEFAENGESIFEFVPFAESGKQYIPYAAAVSAEDGELKCPAESVTLIRWGRDYEMRFKPLAVETYQPPVILAQNSIFAAEGTTTVTVYKDTRVRVIAEGVNIFTIHTVPWDINNTEVRLNQSGNKTVAAVSGNYDGMKYLLILLFADMCTVLYENIADDISFNQNNIALKISLHDMRGRILKTALTYNGSKYTETSRSYEYTNEHTYIGRLLPYALLEAVMAGDIMDASSYLDNNLKAEDLAAYFGEISEITEPKFGGEKENRVAVIAKKDGKHLAVLYDFEVKNDKIVNISEADTPEYCAV